MFHSIRRPSPAMTVAVVALVLALAGTGYAAATIGTSDIKRGAVTRSKIRNKAVTRSKIRNNAVTSSKVRNRTLLRRDFRRGQLPRGRRGPRGFRGFRGATGAAGASALNPVPSGQTIRGVVGADFHAADNDASDFGVDVTLPMRAASGLADTDVHVNVAGQQQDVGQTPATTSDTNAGCTGTPTNPTAPPGDVCIYVSGADHAFNVTGFSALFGTGASPYGFKLKWDASQEGDSFVDATWAYRAP